MMDPAEKERLETLAGSRGRQVRAKAAVRIEDLAGFLALNTRLQSNLAAGATPTAAEHDALVADMRAINAALTVVIKALTARLQQ